MEHLANFSVSGNAKIFALLTKHLYSYPKSAAIREVGTNAIDATRENGIDPRIESVEIIVEGGLHEELTILKFVDRGIGISPTRMDLFLASLGSSSKTGDPDQNGAFGIGILSILNVSDQFAIETTTLIDGELTAFHYIVFLGSNGIPTYTRIDVERAGPSSGTTVSFPLKDAGYWEAMKLVLDIWNPSDCTSIQTRRSGGSLNDRREAERPKTTLLVQNGFSLVGTNSILVECLSEIVVVIKVGDVLYPILSGEDALCAAFDDLDAALLPRELVKLWTCIFKDRSRSYTHAGTTYAQWHLNRQNAAILFLEFAKGEIELPASREQVVSSEANLKQITARAIAAVTAIGADLQADLDRLMSDRQLLRAYGLAAKVPIFDRLDFSADLSFPLRDLDFQFKYLSNIFWTYGGTPTCTSPDIDTACLITIADKLFRTNKLIKIDLIILVGGKRNTITRAGLERSLGVKLKTIGLFLAIPVVDTDAAADFLAKTKLDRLGHDLRIVDLIPPIPRERKPPIEPEKPPGQLQLIPSIEVLGGSFHKALHIQKCLSTEIVDNFVEPSTDALSPLTPAWYLPIHSPGLESGITKGELLYCCFLGYLLGISGSVAFYYQDPIPAFHLELPVTKDLVAEIQERITTYLARIGPDCRELGFIPGVNTCYLHAAPLSIDAFTYSRKEIISLLAELEPHLSTIGLGLTERERHLREFCINSRRLNSLIFHHYHWLLLAPDSEQTTDFCRDYLDNAEVDDQSDGWQTNQFLVEIVARAFPLIAHCSGVAATRAGERSRQTYWNRDVCDTQSTLKLLVDSLPTIAKL